jgi:hypothetical protein
MQIGRRQKICVGDAPVALVTVQWSMVSSWPGSLEERLYRRSASWSLYLAAGNALVLGI